MPATPPPRPRTPLPLWLALILVATVVAHLPTFQNDFIRNWDTPEYPYIQNNPLITALSWDHIKTIFSEQYDGHYHPLAMLSLALDYRMGGLNPWPYHLTNVVLHSLNAVLVFFLIRTLSRNALLALATALLFGIHPIHVESVSWLSERKTLLYTFFFLASLLAYLHYLSTATRSRWRYYVGSLLLFVLSLLSKSQAVTLSATLILIDDYRNRRLLDRKVLLEKAPFIALTLTFGIIAQAAQAAAKDLAHDAFSTTDRIAFAGYSYVEYILKLFAPLRLAVFYPYPQLVDNAAPSYLWLYGIPAILILALTLYSRKRSPTIAFGLAFYSVNIFFLLKQFRVPFGNYIMADRYAYVPSIGIFLIIAFGALYLPQKSRLLGKTVPVVFAGYALLLLAMTYARTGVWKNDFALFGDLTRKYPRCVEGWNNLGLAEFEAGHYREAIADFNRAVDIAPTYFNALNNLGLAYDKLQDWDTAIAFYQRAIAAAPQNIAAYLSCGVAYANTERLDQAADMFKKAIEQDPGSSKAHFDLGLLYFRQGRLDPAIEQYLVAIQKDPGNIKAHNNLGLAYDRKGLYDKSIAEFEAILKIDPSHRSAYTTLSEIYRRTNDLRKAEYYSRRAHEMEGRR